MDERHGARLSQGLRGRLLVEADDAAGAVACFAEAIDRLRREFLGLPAASAGVMRLLVGGYRDACAAAELPPDKALLAPIEAALAQAHAPLPPRDLPHSP